jgi:hypothetical protein
MQRVLYRKYELPPALGVDRSAVERISFVPAGRLPDGSSLYDLTDCLAQFTGYEMGKKARK